MNSSAVVGTTTIWISEYANGEAKFWIEPTWVTWPHGATGAGLPHGSVFVT